ncbi:MAG: ribonuclease P protein component [Ferruginibacter sp.]
MVKPLRYTLGKTERLKSRKLIAQLFEQGKSFSVFPFKIIYLVETAHIRNRELQTGFSVSSKNFKKAVDRNRIKRLTKEAYRLQKADLAELIKQNNLQLAMFFIYIGKEIPEQLFVSEKINAALKKLIAHIGKAST